MNVILTGHRGLVGRHVFAALRSAGHSPTGFDLIDGDDLRDPAALRRATTGRHAADLARACVAALTCPLTGYRAHLIAAPHLSSSGPTARDWVRRLHPRVPWRGGREYDDHPHRSLLDDRPVRRLLGQRPAPPAASPR